MCYIEKFGKEYYHRIYSKIKNAQEAHEAIRPTRLDVDNLVGNDIDDDMKKLYNYGTNNSITNGNC